MNSNEEKIRLLELQLFATIVFLVVTIVSSYFTYDEIKRLKNEPSLDQNFRRDVSYILRVISVLVVIIFLYVDVTNYKIAKDNNENLRAFTNSIIVSSITLIASILALINTITTNNDIANTENPNV
mgnify:CR=1 FL=1